MSLEHEGAQDGLLNVALAPKGSPEAENVTGSGTPLMKLAVIVVESEPLGCTIILPEFERA